MCIVLIGCYYDWTGYGKEVGERSFLLALHVRPVNIACRIVMQ